MSTVLFVTFFAILGIAVVLVAMRSGSRGPVLDPQRRTGRRVLAWLTALAVIVFAVVVPLAVGFDNDNRRAGATSLTANEVKGRELFTTYCSNCHALAATSAVGRVGPDLDKLRPPKGLVLDAIEKGRARGQGQMPSLLVTGEEADHVAAFIEKVAGR